MTEPSKQIKRALRDLAGRAHEEELARALRPLAEAFDAWRAGRLDVWQLNDLIHRYHDGPQRQLWKRYADLGPLATPMVAHAIVAGILYRAAIPPDVLEYLSAAIAVYERDAK